MLFNSIEFLIFFPIVLLVYFSIPDKAKKYWLLIASYYFYMCWNAKYALLILASTIITYVSGLLIEKIKLSNHSIHTQTVLKKCVVAASFISNLGILFYFKYINFTINIIVKVFEKLHIILNQPTFDIILPVSISFYTFQALIYTIDVYRNEIYAEITHHIKACILSLQPYCLQHKFTVILPVILPLLLAPRKYWE